MATNGVGTLAVRIKSVQGQMARAIHVDSSLTTVKAQLHFDFIQQNLTLESCDSALMTPYDAFSRPPTRPARDEDAILDVKVAGTGVVKCSRRAGTSSYFLARASISWLSAFFIAWLWS